MKRYDESSSPVTLTPRYCGLPIPSPLSSAGGPLALSRKRRRSASSLGASAMLASYIPSSYSQGSAYEVPEDLMRIAVEMVCQTFDFLGFKRDRESISGVAWTSPCRTSDLVTCTFLSSPSKSCSYSWLDSLTGRLEGHIRAYNL